MPEDYEVQEGDCMSSIAYQNGFLWQTLWNHSANSDLKQNRKDPNILMPGDVVHIPDLTIRQESGATEQRHTFQLKGSLTKLKLKLLRPKPADKPSSPPGSGDTTNGLDPDYKPPKNEQEPIRNTAYVFELDGVRMPDGTTDGDGCLEVPIQPDSSQAKVVINKGQPDEKTFWLELGGMDPIDEIVGARKRLHNLGFFCEEDGAEDAPDLKAALRKFQEWNSLNISGSLDDTTRSKLKEIHGS